MFRIITCLEDQWQLIKLHTIIPLYFNNYLRRTRDNYMFKHAKYKFIWIKND